MVGFARSYCNQDERDLQPLGSTKQYFFDNVGARIGINPDLHNSIFCFLSREFFSY